MNCFQGNLTIKKGCYGNNFNSGCNGVKIVFLNWLSSILNHYIYLNTWCMYIYICSFGGQGLSMCCNLEQDNINV